MADWAREQELEAGQLQEKIEQNVDAREWQGHREQKVEAREQQDQKLAARLIVSRSHRTPRP